MAVDSENIKKLREMTSAGMLDCKKALEETDGDIDKAAALLRERGIIKAVKKMEREAKEGQIFSYIHHNGQFGVLLELNCETDFVARNEVFQNLGKNIAMHIGAAIPEFLRSEDVPQERIDTERDTQRKLLLEEGKPESAIEKIMEGKIKKFLSEIVLLDQAYIREPKLTISDLIKEAISTLGENISVGRFIRYAVK